MKQNRVPRIEYIIQPKGKTNPYRHDVIYSDLGQWKYPGQVTRIPSNQITMQGVPYPVQGVDDTGYSQMMYPGMDYQFPGQSVTEYPMAAYGGDPSLNDIEGYYPFGGQNTKTHTHMAQGGWLDQYQGSVGGNQVPKSKPKIDFEGSRRTSSNSFPTSKIEAEEMLAEQRKPGYKKEDNLEYYREKAYRNKEEETVNTHVPQSTSSKAIEILSNPGLALKNYRGGRLPDYFSSNQEVDMADPLNVMNMGYQFLTPVGRAAYTLQSADDVDRDLENEDYISAGIDAAFVLPGLGEAKNWAKKLNKISRAKNIENIKKAAKTQKETAPFTYKGVVEKFPGNTSLRNDLAKLKYDKGLKKQNPKLAGTWVNQHEEFMKGRPMSPDATGIIQPPSDPNYLYNFKTYTQPPLEQRFKNYKKEDGGWLEDEYRRGGQKRKKYTSKNIQSSVNDLFKTNKTLFRRNETLFGPVGKKRYKPGLKYKSGGGWLDNLH